MKKTLLSLLLITAIFFSLSACKNSGSPKESESQTQETSINSQDGFDNIFGALEDLSGTNPDGTTSVLPNGDININGNTSSESVPMPKPIPDGKPIKVELDKNGFPKKPLYATYINKFISDGIYKLECTYSITESDLNLVMPFTLAVKGAKTFIEMDMTILAGKSTTTQIITNGKKSYIVLPTLKKYVTSTPEDNENMLGDISNLIDSSSGKYVKTTEVKMGNKRYICEIYKENGTTVKCYFLDGKTFARQEILSPEGNVILSDIKYSNDVEDELFELPKGYRNIDKLVGLLS